jgi:hypothetical protein
MDSPRIEISRPQGYFSPMLFRKFLSIAAILFLLVEPAMSLVPTASHSRDLACSTCGMKGTCGVVCCCHPHAHQNSAPSKVPSLYSAGCHQDKDSAAPDLSNNPRWIPQETRLDTPNLLSASAPILKAFSPNSIEEIPSPPPDLGLLP